SPRIPSCLMQLSNNIPQHLYQAPIEALAESPCSSARTFNLSLYRLSRKFKIELSFEVVSSSLSRRCVPCHCLADRAVYTAASRVAQPLNYKKMKKI
ncbi:hypothetical protein, partial [Curvivirga aplysinae]|uniref:hypothetical protein n=1 Tax=Curvivirga aplysinae TaxID=2529852 RepID=UPI001C3FD506